MVVRNRTKLYVVITPEEQLILTLMDLFLGGSETVGTFLNWAILFLTLNPAAQTRIKEEINSTLPPNEPITLEHINRQDN
jgi:cytochrome P450 family 2 subfamily J